MVTNNFPTDYKRECDGCTKCCEGWLTSQIYNNFMFPGRPCHFKSEKGCSIYKDRPNDPCITYNCEWKKNLNIPEWLKPSESKVILTRKKVEGIEYLEAKEAGQKITVEILNWLILEQFTKKINLVYEVDGRWNWLGSSDFGNALMRNDGKNVSNN